MREITLKRNEWKNIYQVNRALKICNKNNYPILLLANFYDKLISKKDEDFLQQQLIKYIICYQGVFSFKRRGAAFIRISQSQ